MRRHILLICLFIMPLAACQPSENTLVLSPEPPTPEAAGLNQLEFDSHIDFAHEGVSIILPKPKGWETLSADSGLFIAEHFARLADRGIQHGLMASVFVTPLSEFAETGSTNGQRTRDILTALIAANPDDEHRSGDVQPFDWSGYDAAYYLVSEAAAGPQMLVVGVTFPDEGVLMTGSVSAPRSRAGQIREAAPLLLGGVAVNGVVLGPNGLNTLPDPLVFPE
jgi:hypothetical protein